MEIQNAQDLLDLSNLPKHVAIIMDGNGRWAQQRGEERVFGHHVAIESVRQVAEGCAEIGVDYLTLYTFSTENWGRPKEEVDAIMNLLAQTIRKETETLNKNKIKLRVIGDLEGLPSECQRLLGESMKITENNKGLILSLALNYSGRWDILQAAKKLRKLPVQDSEKMDEESFCDLLSTAGYPDPELMIRTSGEMRISNFLLWQIAYSEIFITDTLWPDFRKENLFGAINWYQNRERRFGKTGEQIKQENIK